MLDLGTSFVASVARDPDALAIVDEGVRLTYAQWYRRISSLVASLDRLGLKPGDHLVTVLQNREAAATLHWACQFAGIVITPINWRAKADELDFCIENSGSRAVVYQDVFAPRRSTTRTARETCRAFASAVTTSPACIRFDDHGRRARGRGHPARQRRSLVDHALHVRHHVEAERRAAPPPRRARRRASPMSRRISTGAASARSA